MTTKLRYTKGTIESDNIHGYGWKDKMSGYEGDDILWGVGGWDTLAGGNGNDTLLGGAGSDVMGGGAGDDLLIGSEDVGPEDYRTMSLEDYLRKIIYDNDRLYGGAGNDTIYGGFGQDKLVGGSGRDYLDGGVGHDSLNGGSGNDMLHGGEGRDTLKGGAGGDVLDGGRGNDRVYAGAGDDLGVFDWGENVGFHNIYNGGRGVDYLRIKLTGAEWARADIKADILALAEAMADHTNPVTGEHDNTVFKLATTNLKVRGFENLQIMVDDFVLPTLVDAVNDHVTVQEDAPVTVLGSVLSNDVNAHLVDKVEVIWGPAQGTLVMDEDTGNYTFDSSTAFTGLSSGQSRDVTFRYRITDVFGGTDEAVGRITVNGIDDVPVAADDYYTNSEDEVLTVSAVPGLLSNDTSTIGTPPLTVQAFSGMSAMGAQVTVNADGSFTYDPTGSAQLQALNEEEFAVDTFTYTVQEPDGDTATGTANVHVSGLNERPTAVDDFLTMPETDSLGASGQLLNNDIPGTVGDTLSLVPGTVTSALGATVVFLSNGYVRYDQRTSQALDELAEGEVVQDTFSYTIMDQNGQTDTATVTFEITGVEDLPTASPDSYNASEGVVLTVDAASGVLANDTTDGNTGHTIAAKPQVLTSATTGATLSLNADGSFVYDPTSSAVIEGLEEGQFLTDSFEYTIEESDKDTATAEIGILVTGAAETIAPIANDYTYEDVEDTTPRTGMRLFSGNDDTLFDHVQKGAATDVLTMDFGTEAGSTIGTDKGGNVFVNANSSFIYYAPYTKETALLNVGESFTDTFDFTVQNQAGQSSTGTITLKLDGVDDNPDATDDAYNVYHYVGYEWNNIPQHFGLLANDTPHLPGDQLFAVPMAVFDADPDKKVSTLFTDLNNSATFTTDKGGVVTLFEDGSFTYETAGVDGIGDLVAGQKIEDSFDYLLLDEYYNGDVGTVTLDIMLGEYR